MVRGLSGLFLPHDLLRDHYSADYGDGISYIALKGAFRQTAEDLHRHFVRRHMALLIDLDLALLMEDEIYHPLPG